MKVWNGYGSEHSMNLVMIGHFKSADDAEQAKQLIDELVGHVQKSVDEGVITVGEPTQRFPDEMLTFMMDRNFILVTPQELEQFVYEHQMARDGADLILTTEESEFSAFLKVFVDKGARVEVFSAHNYPSEHGRQTSGS